MRIRAALPAALPTNSSLTDGIYFDDLVAQAPERKQLLSSPRHRRDVAHAQTGLAQTRRFLVLFQPAAPPAALSAAFPASVNSFFISSLDGCRSHRAPILRGVD